MNNSNNSPSNKKTPEQVAAEAQQISNTFARLFGTPEGQVVLGDLNQAFLVNTVPPNADHAYYSGAKFVMTYIINHMQKGAGHVHERKP